MYVAAFARHSLPKVTKVGHQHMLLQDFRAVANAAARGYAVLASTINVADMGNTQRIAIAPLSSDS